MPREPRRYNSSRWKPLRLQILKRDDHICQYCSGKADRVHHVIAWRRDPSQQSWFDPDNPKAICNGCNARQSYADGGRSHERREPNVWSRELQRGIYIECPGHGQDCKGYHSRAW
jgi:5-methylcytosine-specific restriction endonuclease McrA